MVPPAIVFSSAIAGAAATVAVLCCLMWRTRNRTPWVGWLLLMSTAHAGFALSQVCRNSASDLVTGDLAIRGIGFFSAVLAMA